MIINPKLSQAEQRQIRYLLYLALSLLIPNLVLQFFALTSVLDFCLKLLLALGFYLLVLFLPRRIRKVGVVLLFLASFFNIFQLVYAMLFSGGVIAVDMFLNIFTSNSNEASELLSSLALFIALAFALYTPFYVILFRLWRKDEALVWHIRGRVIAVVAPLILSLALLASYILPNSFNLIHDVYPFNMVENMYVAGQKLIEMDKYPQTVKGFVYNAKSTHAEEQKEVYVLVLGETSRAMNWSLYGYERETTPYLDSLQNDLLIYRDVLTQSNTTYKSVPIILSPAEANSAKQLPKVRSLIIAMKEAGFHTIYLSNQPENRSYVDFFASESDEFYRMNKVFPNKEKTYDTDMLALFDRAIKANECHKLFIVLHTYGSHFNYKDRYPKAFARFTPDNVERTTSSERTKLVNAYDNAIRYTDYFLKEVLQRLELKAEDGSCTAMMYLSDHGEDLFDDSRKRILHSSPSLSYYQLHIPMFLWFSENYKALYPKKIEQAKEQVRSPLSTNVVFHSLLDLAGVETTYRNDSLSLFSPNFQVNDLPRQYLNDRYECQEISDLKLNAEDQAMWQKMHLRPEW